MEYGQITTAAVEELEEKRQQNGIGSECGWDLEKEERFKMILFCYKTPICMCSDGNSRFE